MSNGYNYKVKVEKENSRTKPFIHNEIDPTSAFDLPAIIEDLRHGQNWMSGEISTVLLLNSPSIKVLLTLLHEGTEVISYQDNESIKFQVLEGSLIIHLRNESIVLHEGELLTLDENIKYSFDTIEETAFLLTLVSGKEGTEED
jgi:quercetin dioxygenase-like cupin family protein